MSITAPTSPLVKSQTSSNPRALWITPEEQLERLHLSIAEEVSSISSLISNLGKIIAEYTGDEPEGHWYSALKRLGVLPKKIPPLPSDIHEILNSKCPIHGDQEKEDGIFYKVKDTHFLSLVLSEFTSLNYLERAILGPFREQKYSEDENPLQIRRFWHEARKKHGDAPFPETHWILVSKGVLPESGYKTWDQQIGLVNALKETSSVDYEIPTLQDSCSAIITDMVATGGKNVYTYTRVKDLALGYHLVIGDNSLSGLCIGVYTDVFLANIGVAVLRKF